MDALKRLGFSLYHKAPCFKDYPQRLSDFILTKTTQVFYRSQRYQTNSNTSANTPRKVSTQHNFQTLLPLLQASATCIAMFLATDRNTIAHMRTTGEEMFPPLFDYRDRQVKVKYDNEHFDILRAKIKYNSIHNSNEVKILLQNHFSNNILMYRKSDNKKEQEFLNKIIQYYAYELDGDKKHPTALTARLVLYTIFSLCLEQYDGTKNYCNYPNLDYLTLINLTNSIENNEIYEFDKKLLQMKDAYFKVNRVSEDEVFFT
ncbi:MAG: hypothetical protein S4CHLAM20_02610 [Chlamydiia bacterium]|nr:hypothetical protein [Chlamydiia bacterium]